MNILCRLGFHRWTLKNEWHISSAGRVDTTHCKEIECDGCGKQQAGFFSELHQEWLWRDI